MPAVTAANPLALPSYGASNPYMTSPTFSGGYDLGTAAANHPTLFSPSEWGANIISATQLCRGYTAADSKLLSLRYAFAPSFYAGMEVGTFAPTTLRGTYPLPLQNPPAFNSLSTYRLDPAHTYRNIMTTLSADLDRPGLMPMLAVALCAVASS